MSESAETGDQSKFSKQPLSESPADERTNKALTAIEQFDPELLRNDDTRRLVELGIQFGNEVTDEFGTPAEPKLASGELEKRVPMTYHNGGENGHTSIGPEGVGVPRNALVIAQRVNEVAGREVFDVRMRAIAFYAAMAHDRTQLCGRALMDEGRIDKNHGDERLSAQNARGRYIADIVSKPIETLTAADELHLTPIQKETADLIHAAVMATAFDTTKGSQNITYKDGWTYQVADKETQFVLMQELVAGADLLGPSSLRGALGAIEYCVEALGLKDKDQLLQKKLGAELGEVGRTFTPEGMEELLGKISANETLRKKFTDLVAGQIQFFSHYLTYSDRAIRAATNGYGVKELFSLGIEESIKDLNQYYTALTAAEPQFPLDIWQKAHNAFQAKAEEAQWKLFPAITQEEPSVPQTDEQKARTLCITLKERFPTTFRGAYQFGSPGSADLDLELCFKGTIPTPEEQKIIRTSFQELNLEAEVDIHFINEQAFRDGKVADLDQFAKAEAHLQYGFDPHYEQAAAGDTSLFSAYLFATMKPFYEDPSQQLIDPEIAFQNVRLNRDGAIGWTHYYTGCFLGEYRHYKENTDLSSPAYQKRLAKFFARVTLGSTLAQLNQTHREQLQPQLIDALKDPDQSKSSDEKMAEVLLANPDTRALLSDEDRELLQLAGKIRSSTTTEFSEDFVRRAESMLFYNAFQQGIEQRIEPGQPIDYLTSYTFEMLARDPTIGAKREEISTNQPFIKQGDIDIDERCYYIPLGENPQGVEVVVQTQTGEEIYKRVSGSLVGEGPIFGILRRSGTVTALEDGTYVLAIDARSMQNLLANPDTFTALQESVLQSNDTRMADVLLQYFARESSRFVKETLPYTILSSKEIADSVYQENPLDQYDLKKGFHDIIAKFVSDQPDSPVTKISSPSGERVLFEQHAENKKLYIVSGSEGTVKILLETGEEINLGEGEVFGESSLLGTLTTGSATLSSGGSVLAVDASWFQRFTQSRRPIEDLPTLPDNFQNSRILPRHLLYHLACVGYERVRRRLATQEHPSA